MMSFRFFDALPIRVLSLFCCVGWLSACSFFRVEAPCFEDGHCDEGLYCDAVTETCRPSVGRTDAGQPSHNDGGLKDAGADHDAGGGVDGGRLEDGGGPGDAGSPPQDAGPLKPDAGSAVVDGGFMSDAGHTDQDAGDPLDAGLYIDGGHSFDGGGDAGGHTDAGVLLDAGTVHDAGGLLDAGLSPDAGLSLDAGVPTICGNGIVEVHEACDDGNATPEDGCFQCVIEPDYICWGEPSYCDTDGNIAWVSQSPDGGAAYSTISEALEATHRTIFVQAGTYGALDLGSSDSHDNRAIIGENGVLLTSTGIVLKVTADNVTLSGIAITNTGNEDCLEMDDADGIVLTNITIDGCGKHGVEGKSTPSFTLDRCSIKNAEEHGLHVDGLFTVSNCIIEGNGQDGMSQGIKLKGNTDSSSALLFNTVANNGGGAAEGAMKCDSSALFRGNLFIDNAPAGESEFANCSSYVFYSRTAASNLEDMAFMNTDCEPSFVDDGSRRLSSESECANRFPDTSAFRQHDGGAISNWPMYDLDGRPRLMGTGYEPGAFELPEE